MIGSLVRMCLFHKSSKEKSVKITARSSIFFNMIISFRQNPANCCLSERHCRGGYLAPRQIMSVSVLMDGTMVPATERMPSLACKGGAPRSESKSQ